jgi:hypothetical protein
MAKNNDMTPHAIVNPHATAIVWNYDDRMMEPVGAQDPQKISETIIISSSIQSIRTERQKSSPAGTFEIVLAPTFNWVTRLTVGSWVAILMTRDRPIPKTILKDGADPKSFKMLGRIDSVRVAVAVDGNTGARSTTYVVSGRDWGCVFDNTVYVDVFGRAVASPKSNLGDIFQFGVLTNTLEGSTDDNALFSTTQLVEVVKDFYGRLEKNRVADSINSGLGSKTFPNQIFKVPKEVSKFCGFGGDSFKAPTAISDLIQVKAGVLVGDDKYNDKIHESCGLFNPMQLLGEHTFWQVLMDHSNPILNELLTGIRWEAGKPQLTLYKRLKPFTSSEANISANLKADVGALISKEVKKDAPAAIAKLKSPFQFLKKTKLATVDVLSIDAGTNWRDKINFIEVMSDDPDCQALSIANNSAIKGDTQIYDQNAASREGLKTMILRTRFYPVNGNEPPGKNAMPQIDWLGIVGWKYLLREWYFNTHNMLNGVVSFVGQNEYIDVGENIMIPAAMLGPTTNFTKSLSKKGSEAYLLAHIETITNQFMVNEDGTRSFATSIQFVRGVFTDANGNTLSKDAVPAPALEQKSSTLKPVDEFNNKNTVAVTTDKDLDPDKDVFRA